MEVIRLNLVLTQTKTRNLNVDEVKKTTYVCDTPSFKVVVATADFKGAKHGCTNGGHKVEAGLDKNQDKTLNDGEEEKTIYVCHLSGGGSGSSVGGGATSDLKVVVKTTAFTGANHGCSNGGYTVEAGLDTNKNGKLDAGEEAKTKYVCDQPSSGVKILVTASILDGKAPQCSAEGGGTEFKIGLDKDGDNLLDPDEVRKTEYVCRTVVRTWKSISTKSSHVLGIKTDGTLWAWGGDTFTDRFRGPDKYGVLGIGSTGNSNVPVQVAKAYKWKSVSAGRYHSLAIRSDDTLWAWGKNWSCYRNGTCFGGALGIGTTSHSDVPVQVAIGHTWKSVSAGDEHSLAIRSDETLWAWGMNFNKQLGLGITSRYTLFPSQIGSDSWIALAVTRSLIANTNAAARWKHFKWKSVSAGANHSLAIRSDDTLWAWGFNGNGQIGDSTTTTRVIPVRIAGTWESVSSGTNFNLGIQSGGTLWTWGQNNEGQLGFHLADQRLVPSQIGGDSWIQIAITRDVFGTNRGPNDAIFKGWKETKWQSVATGHLHSLAIRSDGTLWAWGGSANQGSLGFRSKHGKAYPHQVDDRQWRSITAGYALGLGIRKSHVQWLDQTLFSWGSNSSGQLGGGVPIGLKEYKHTPVPVKIP